MPELESRRVVETTSSTRFALALVLGLAACERQPTQPPEPTPKPEPAMTCEGVERLASTWSATREQALADALADQPGEWPRRMISTLDRRVHAGGAAWAASYRSACADHDLARQRCLDRQADALDGLITLTTRAPELAARLAMWAEIQLVGVEACETSPSPYPGPLAPELGAELAATSLLFSLNELPRAVEGVNQLAEMHAIVDDPIYVYTLDTMSAVLELAYGNRESASVRFSRLALLADQVGARERSSFELLGAMLEANLGNIPGAVAAFERALAAERELGDPIRIAFALQNLGAMQRVEPDIPAAIASWTEAIALFTRELGSESAHVAETQLSLSELRALEGRTEAAQDLLLQARDGFSASLGSDHPATHDVVLRLGRLLLAAGRPSDAYHAFLDLLEISVDQYGERDVRVGDAKLELAEALRAMGEHEGARLTFLEALPILVEGHGADHRSIVQLSAHLGQSLVELGKVSNDHALLDEAETHCTRARSLALPLNEADPLRLDADQCIQDLAAARKRAGKRKPKPG